MIKRILCVLASLVLLAALTSTSVSCELEEEFEIGSHAVTETGRVLISGKAFLIIYDDGSFLVMNNISDNEDMFSGLTSGDLIKITRNPEVAESYPAQCYVKKCKKLEDGDLSDISRKAVDDLRGMGWIDNADFETESGAQSYDTEDETAGDVTHKAPSFDDRGLTTEELAYLISKTSDLHFDLLYEMTYEEIEREGYKLEPGFGCYTVVIEQEETISLSYAPNKTVMSEYRYTFTAYPDESDGGSYLTHVSTNSQIFKVCDVHVGALYNIISTSFIEKGFDVDTTNGREIAARRSGIQIFIRITDDYTIMTDINITVTNKEGIIY